MLNILNYEIKKGDKFMVDVPVSDGEGRKTHFPFYAICGEKDGPVLCITSGVHGTEYPGIGANLALYHEIKPEELAGTIIGVPQCNFASFQAKVPFVNPLDGKNLNDTFPGAAEGTITERLCYTLVHEVAAKADYHIDMHSGDSTEWLYPYAFYHISEKDEKVTETAQALAKVYGLDYVSYTETAGAGATDKGNFYAAVSELGIPSIQPEIGGIGLIEEETKMLHYEGAKNVMKHLGMLCGEAEENPRQKELFRFYRLKAPKNGIYHCHVTPGEKVKKGQLLAVLTDYHGDEVYCEFYAEEDAVILWVMSTFAACEGDNLMAIGVI